MASESDNGGSGTEKQKGFGARLDSALVVLLLTAFTYATAFAYEAGYLAYFGLPPDFAEVSLRSLLICAIFVFASVIFLIFVLDQLLRIRLRRASDTLSGELKGLLVVLVLLFALCKLLGAPWYLLALFLGGVAGIQLFTFFVEPELKDRSSISYWAKVENAASDRDSEFKIDAEKKIEGLAKYWDSRMFDTCSQRNWACGRA